MKYNLWQCFFPSNILVKFANNINKCIPCWPIVQVDLWNLLSPIHTWRQYRMKMKDILSYESDIWSCADLLIASGIKQSKFPDYMMPFFALIMLEGRMRNKISELEAIPNGPRREIDMEEFIEVFQAEDCGYNQYIVREGKTLSEVCDNDKTFEQDFRSYIEGFDTKLKELLGIERGTDDSKYLNLDGMVAELRKKGILMQYVTKWAQIDLSPYNNSEITTLEEHIKRRWADISAETAGEQYTPEDIISLIAEIVTAEMAVCSKEGYLWLYDPTCGGANLLFGVADRFKDVGFAQIATRGQDFNDSLYALAKIESLFRDKSKIEYGNTLTEGKFKGIEFDVVVANPPYGIPWKGFEKEIRNDSSGQFAYLPSVSDGQLLFLQHNAAHLHKEKGIVVEVNNGSSLFSGDAGSGESNIRKYLFDNDWVEAIIQMPSDEFFNTGIVTYLWVLNKNKSVERHDKVILINASDLWQPLKKNRGSKRKEMNAGHRAEIVRALVEFRDCNIAKVYDKWHFYFNKQKIQLTDPEHPKGKYNDYELIPYLPKVEENEAGIDTFLRKYIIKPYRKLENTVGVEINFNKEFYVPETVDPVDSILVEIAEIDNELANLEKGLGL